MLFGRRTYPDRRGFLKNAGLAAMGALVGAAIPFHRNMPAHFIPVALAAETVIPGKDGLTVLNDRPMCAETPPHLLDDAITPTERHFVRNNGLMPERPGRIALDNWRSTALVDHPLTFGIEDLKSALRSRNPRAGPGMRGQWTGFLRPEDEGRTVDLRRGGLLGMDGGAVVRRPGSRQ